MIRLLAAFCMIVALASALWLWNARGSGIGADLAGDKGVDAAQANEAIALAVLGDSDSHSYQDRRSFAPGNKLRGGQYRATTLQWTEALARMRGDQLYLGHWGLHGVARPRALVDRLLGGEPAPPRKEDYRYNFAVSGSKCSDLMGGKWQFARSLAAQMRREPERWRNGVVVIRIGVNSFGQTEHLKQLAFDSDATGVQDEISRCVREISETVKLLHAQQPGLRIVLVGIFNNAHWAKRIESWQSPQALANIQAGLGVFDQALLEVVAQDSRLAFFDDQAWFKARWGSRDPSGRPAYRSVHMGALEVTNSIGDAPRHAVVADGHAGTVYNSLWAQSLVDCLNTNFALGVTPISDAEVLALVQRNAIMSDQALVAAQR